MPIVTLNHTHNKFRIKNIYISLLLVLICTQLMAQQSGIGTNKLKTNTKLVVGVVVDQMRYDYLTRFYAKFGEGGFKRLVSQGFLCKNAHFNYIPTKTAPGHATIATGANPSQHGVLGNQWYSRKKNKLQYCVADNTVTSIGTSSTEGKKSPKLMQLTTLADQNKLHTQFKGKTISISLKDRAAILSGGHLADAAYWFRGDVQGAWISSSFYMKSLPNWLVNYNEKDVASSYLKEWNTLYPINTYTESGADNSIYEEGFKGQATTTFPYDLNALKEANNQYDILALTPFGNSITTDFAKAVLTNENLGKDKFTDFLLISYSSTDYIGHNFGVNSKEIEDTYIRLDKELERLFVALDLQMGRGKYTLYLTADHGATHVPQYLKHQKIPAGYFGEANLKPNLEVYIKQNYGVENGISKVLDHQVYLNEALFKEKKINLISVRTDLADFIRKQPDIHSVYTRDQFQNNSYTKGDAALLQNGFHQVRSGDIFFELLPLTINYSIKGTTHGSGYNYDTHVPLLFYGEGIKKGSSAKKIGMTQLTPTIAALLGIAFPSGSSKEVIIEVLKK